VIVMRVSEDEREWVKHAAALRGLSLTEYIKRAVNASLCREGVDAVLFAESTSTPDGSDGHDAEAKLVAAAPALLAAVRGLARGASDYPCFCKVAIGKATRHTIVCLNAVAAIARAEGRP